MVNEEVKLSSLPRLDHDVAWVDVAGEIVAVQKLNETVHLVSHTGALLWPFLDGATTVSELAADVADVFGLEASAAIADVVAFIEDMVHNGLVVLGEADAS